MDGGCRFTGANCRLPQAWRLRSKPPLVSRPPPPFLSRTDPLPSSVHTHSIGRPHIPVTRTISPSPSPSPPLASKGCVPAVALCHRRIRPPPGTSTSTSLSLLQVCPHCPLSTPSLAVDPEGGCVARSPPHSLCRRVLCPLCSCGCSGHPSVCVEVFGLSCVEGA